MIKANEATSDAVQVGGSNAHLFPIPVPLISQAKNQLLNGDFSHSVMTWNDQLPNTGGDRNEECAWWFSNDEPVLGQVLPTDVTAAVFLPIIWGGAP